MGIDSSAVFKVIGSCSSLARKGSEVEEHDVGGVRVTEVFLMPHADEFKDRPHVEVVDMVLAKVAVDKAAAEAQRAEFDRMSSKVGIALEFSNRLWLTPEEIAHQTRIHPVIVRGLLSWSALSARTVRAKRGGYEVYAFRENYRKKERWYLKLLSALAGRVV